MSREYIIINEPRFGQQYSPVEDTKARFKEWVYLQTYDNMLSSDALINKLIRSVNTGQKLIKKGEVTDDAFEWVKVFVSRFNHLPLHRRRNAMIDFMRNPENAQDAL